VGLTGPVSGVKRSIVGRGGGGGCLKRRSQDNLMHSGSVSLGIGTTRTGEPATRASA